jgi:hypothetical protein
LARQTRYIRQRRTTHDPSRHRCIRSEELG